MTQTEKGMEKIMERLQLEQYLSRGVENIIKGMKKASFTNPRSAMYLLKYAKAAGRAAGKRRQAEQNGKHVPPFLIASITSQCNLQCKGCYARANHTCGSEAVGIGMRAEQWDDIFAQAEDMGVGFILLAGGEPLMRPDVLKKAGMRKNILFPVFTNGTMINNDTLPRCVEGEAVSELPDKGEADRGTYLQLFMDNRNLLPVLSMEGDRQRTDARRGSGIYDGLIQAMENLRDRDILYGVSVTVTKENMEEVTADAFLRKLSLLGCKAVIYVEYVPADRATRNLAPDDGDREYLADRLELLREMQGDMLLISFPGDERASGGCLAAGRGFFHINASGGAEPCPFSPYSDTSLQETSLRDAMDSPLFCRLREDGSLTEMHTGGCALFEQEKKVKDYLKGIE